MSDVRRGEQDDGSVSVTRRDFIHAVTGATVVLASTWQPARADGKRTEGQTTAQRKRIALIATEVRKYSHAQHFIDRFVEGYGWNGRHYDSPLQLVSLFVDQFPDRDLSRDRCRRHAIELYPTISEALTCGGSRLAVDGVVIIGEHGDYPKNEKGQKLYPRYRFFKEAVKVFEDSGRSVPVFNDKHLSTDWGESVEMVEDSRRLGFAFMAGSSLPVTWRIPAIDLPTDTPLAESVCVCYGGVDSYDIHGLETAQCMSERRKGGEPGVGSVHAVRGEQVWTMLQGCPVTTRLMLAALGRSHTMTPPSGYSYALPSVTWAREAAKHPTAYFIDHLDGHRTTLLMLDGLVSDFTYAGQVKNSDHVISCQMYLPMPPSPCTLANFFSPLVNHIETMILTGKATYPVERTLLTSGMVSFAVESLFRGQVSLKTPELNVAYTAPRPSTYWRT